MSKIVELNSLWIGDELHPVHQLCLLSAVRQGHKVRLFSFAPVKNVPSDIEVAPADDVLPRSAMFLHARTGSPAPFADRFRLNMIGKGFGAWIDTDMLFVKPLTSPAKNIFGWENERAVGNAVLGFDRESSAFQSLLLASNDDYFIPPWFSATQRLYHSSRHAFGIPAHIRHLPYGTTGPRLLTWWVHANHMLEHVLHKDVFYALPYANKFDVFSGAASLRSHSQLPACTVAVHLWFQGLLGGLKVSKKKRRTVPPVEVGSLLHEAAKELGMTNIILSGQ